MKVDKIIVFGVLICLIIILPFIPLTSATTQWTRIYPIGTDAHVRSVALTRDGGYLLGGHTKIAGRTDNNALLVKTDSSGNIQWNKTYGGLYTDEVHSVVVSSDGGFVAAGVTSPSSTLGLLWVFKVSSSGVMLWNNTYGGTHNENGWSITSARDGGYIVAGSSNNFGTGNGDFWVIKIDESGTMQWNKAYGTPGSDVAYSIIQTSDDGYAFTGRQNNQQCILVKIDSSGMLQWNRTYCDPQIGSTGYSLIQTSDSGYAIGGSIGSGSTLGSSNDTALQRDYWLVKTDSSGTLEWSKTYGGYNEEIARSVVQMEDGGYALAGYSESFGAGTQDVWLVMTDSLGNQLSAQTFGGANTDTVNSMIKTSDGGLFLGGNTESFDMMSAALLIIKTDGGGILPDPVTSSWSPSSENAIASTVAATVLTGGVSIAVAAVLLPPGLPSDSIVQKIRDLLPDSFKHWLESVLSSRIKMHVDEGVGSRYLPTRGEVGVYLVSMLITGFSFSYVKVDTIPQIISVLPIILSTTILVSFVKNVVLTTYSRSRGVWAEYKLWYFGLVTFLATTFLFKVPFSSPSRIVHHESKSTPRFDATLATGEVLILLVFAAGFYILLRGGYQVIGSVGLAMCVIGAFFDSLPISPMNGRSIFNFRKVFWAGIFALTLLIYVVWLFFL